MLARIDVGLLLGTACASALGTTPVGSVFRGVERRQSQAGGACGPAGGNAQCAPGLCCGAAGTCGTGGEFCSAPGCLLSFSALCDGNQKPTGKDTSQVPRPLFGNIPYGSDVISCTQPGKLAITFDDGPYIYTAELLDILKKNNVKATFFVVGANGAKGQINQASSGYPSIIKRMHADGHQIASHTWSHEDLVLITPEQRRNQILYNEIAIADILGFFPTYFRPPYTSQNQAVMDELKSLGYHTTNYDLDTKDFEGDYTKSQTTYVNAVLTKQPKVCLAHDIHEKTVRGFTQFMIDNAKQNGYQLVPFGECLGDPASNWYRDPATGGPVNLSSPQPKPSQNISQPVQGSASATATSSAAASSGTTAASSRTSTRPTGIKAPSSATSNVASISSSSAVVPTAVAGGGQFFSGTNNTAGVGSGRTNVTGAASPSGARPGSPSQTGPVVVSAGILASHPIAHLLALSGMVAWILTGTLL